MRSSLAGIAGAVDPALHPGDVVVVPAYWIHQMESVWVESGFDQIGKLCFARILPAKVRALEMIFPNDVQVVRKG